MTGAIPTKTMETQMARKTKTQINDMNEIHRQVMKAYDDITEFQVKYGATQGTRENDKELY